MTITSDSIGFRTAAIILEVYFYNELLVSFIFIFFFCRIKCD